MSNAISIYRGDSLDLSVPVTLKSTGAAFDLTGYKATLTVKKIPSKADSTAIISVTESETLDSTGIILFEITPNDTVGLTPGNYIYDVQVVNESESKVFTVVKDRFIVLEDVTLTGIAE